MSETGQQKTVRLRRVATAGPPTPPFPLHQSPWVMPGGKRTSGPAYSDMKTPREKILFAQFSSLASDNETHTETETHSNQLSGKKAIAWGPELDLNAKTRMSDEIAGNENALREWNEEKVYSRGDVSQLLFTASKERNEKYFTACRTPDCRCSLAHTDKNSIRSVAAQHHRRRSCTRSLHPLRAA